jgi:superfamily II DNA or RNA helicase
VPDHRTPDISLTLYGALSDLFWPSFFDMPSYQRGIRYAAQKRVENGLAVERQGPRVVLQGKVMGNAKRPYRSKVAVGLDLPDGGVITDCSCPVGSYCKHAVALIQTFITRMEKQGRVPVDDTPATTDFLEHDWTRWLERLEQPEDQGVPLERVEANSRLGLFVDINQRAELPTLKLLPVWLRHSRQKNQGSGWVAPRAIEAWRSGELVPAPAEGWSPEQESCLSQLLHGDSDIPWGSQQRTWAVMTHAFQARALWELLQSDEPPLLFHQKQTGILLESGPECQLDAAWETDAQGVQHLRPHLTPEGVCSNQVTFARVGRELCYLDLDSRLFGRLRGEPQRLTRLLQAPPLPPELSEWLSGTLQDRPGLATRLPAPAVVEQHELEGVEPRLQVEMQVATGALSDSPRYAHGGAVPGEVSVGAGVVGFNYDGIAVPPEDGAESRVLHRGQRVIVKRDHDAELTLVRALPSGMVTLERLAELGVVPSDLGLPPWTLLLPVDEALPRSPAQWPSHLAGPEDWWPMIQQLREAGCLVTFSERFPEEPRRVSPEGWHGELEPAGNGWFELGLDIDVEGQRLNLLPILRQLFRDPDFPLDAPDDEPPDASWELTLDEERRLMLPLARLRSLMAPILDWLGDEDDETAALKLPVTAAERLAPLAEHERWAGREDVAALSQRLKALPASLPAPEGFHGELRDYQARGLAWMRFLAELDTGGILADDMGLGKTIQVLAHLLDERQRGALQGPSLVVAPTSLVGNWCAETARFAPGLSVLALQGSKAQRQRLIESDLASADLVVTTYPLLIRDLELLREIPFGLLVLDEAQAIKNAASQTAHAVRGLQAQRALAVTGTPLENHLGELWAQLDAVAPGALGSQRWFGQHFRTPIEKEGDDVQRQRLAQRVAPLMLRRTKQQVLTELPEKTESRREITLSGTQRELYESLRLAQHQRVQQAIAERGLAGSGIVMLDALLKLRQVCCDPQLVKLDSAKRVRRSAKMEQLRELLPPLIEEGRRILIFSQFTEMLALIGKALERDGIAYTTLTGDTPGKVRTQRVAHFQQGEVPVFLISLKAGGVGLNLTAADTVIHYDPWWNPAVEAQATGRAHRLGQQNPVFVYKLVCAGTVEERIIELQARKADLAASILEGGAERSGDGPLFDEEDLALLFAPVA